jgi:hypothetical protein
MSGEFGISAIWSKSCSNFQPWMIPHRFQIQPTESRHSILDHTTFVFKKIGSLQGYADRFHSALSEFLEWSLEELGDIQSRFLLIL